MGINRDIWSTWYNVDRPWSGDGDYETVGAIQNYYGKVCEKGYEIVSAQCRAAGDGEATFDSSTPPESLGDTLQRSCTKDGLICRNNDQLPFGRMCNDYSIRFRCHYTGDDDSDSFFPQFDVRIYIILAVVPILIFLVRIIWAYVFRRRRQRRRQERRARQRANRGSDDLEDDSSSIASGLANPPPSYQELFGSARSSVFAISGSNIPVCAKCESKPCSVALVVSNARQSADNSANNNQTEDNSRGVTGPDSVSVELEMDVTTTNPTAHELEGSRSASPSVPPYDGLAASASSSEQAANEFSEIDLGDAVPSNSNASEESPVHSDSLQLENEEQDQRAASVVSDTSVSPSDVSVAESQSSPLPLSLNPSFIHAKSSISQPCACTCHRTIPFQQQGVTGFENPGYDGDADDTDANTRPSFPGMHVPVPGLHRVWSNLSNNSVVTLSELPSYDDALELMSKKKEAEALQSSN